MAYTDYTNVAAPANWDQTSSGFVVPNLLYSSGGATLSGVVAERDYALSDVWNGAEYDVLGVAYGYAALLVFPTPVNIAELYIEAITDDGGYPTVVFWDSVGSRVEVSGWGTLWVQPYEAADLGGDRKVYGMGFEENPTTPPYEISAIGVLGSGGYPQGIPTTLYGVYGPPAAVEPVSVDVYISGGSAAVSAGSLSATAASSAQLSGVPADAATSEVQAAGSAGVLLSGGQVNATAGELLVRYVASVPLSGVQATAGASQVLVWSAVADAQTPNWQNILS